VATRRIATLLVNPHARRVSGRFNPRAVERYLERRGIIVRTVFGESPSATSQVAREAAARGDDLVFAVGGDGTVRDVADGLAGSETALAAVPSGTVNIWCRETGIPSRARGAFDAHVDGQLLHVDLGRANGRPFLLMASLGWDAAVARSVSPFLKRHLGDYAYMLQGALAVPRLRTHEAAWRWGLAHERHPLAVMVIGNTRIYGGRIEVTPDAVANDGQLDVVALCPPNPLATMRLALRMLRGRLADDPDAVIERVSELTVETPGLPVQLDGDYVAETPMTFTVEPRALLVSIPAGPLPAVLNAQLD
jgi:YegS/Rv2252/BmrU family lipid kinase